MSDRYPAQIRIGGQVSRTAPSKTDPKIPVLEALLNAIGSEMLSNEYGDAPAEPDNEATLMELINEDGWLRLCDEQAINGEIPDLEEFCRTEGLPFNRNCCCYGGYLGEDVTWTPENDMVMILETDDGHEQVDGAEVRRALEVLDMFPAKATPSSIILAKVARALKILQGLCPDIPTVPKFEVIL